PHANVDCGKQLEVHLAMGRKGRTRGAAREGRRLGARWHQYGGRRQHSAPGSRIATLAGEGVIALAGKDGLKEVVVSLVVQDRAGQVHALERRRRLAVMTAG